MKVIAINNNFSRSDIIIAIFAFASSLFISSLYLWFVIPFTMGLLLLISPFWKVIFTVNNPYLVVEFKYLNITYRKVELNVKKVEISNESIILYDQLERTTTEFDIGLSIEETKISSITLYHKNKEYMIGNGEEALLRFKELRNSLAPFDG